MKQQNTPTYDMSGGVDGFHAWLMDHPHTTRLHHERVWNILWHGLRDAQDIHAQQRRKRDDAQYVIHPMELVSQYVTETSPRHISPRDMLILTLHDTIEDHPHQWRYILEKYGIKVFRDILVLSTGGLPVAIRGEIWAYLDDHFPDWSEAKLGSIFFDLRHILSPASPFFKLSNHSKYTENPDDQATQKIKKALRYYARELLNMSEEQMHQVDEETPREFLALANYIYFSPQDTKRKLLDMHNNMRDTWEMERLKPGYLQKRRIKAYLLSVKLKNFGMDDYLSYLVQAFQDLQDQRPNDMSDYAEPLTLPSDAEVSRVIAERSPERVEK